MSTGSTAATNHHRHYTNTAAHLIEERPDWAFDVVGTWEIDATHFERAIDPRKFLLADFGPRRPVEPFTLEFRYDNHFKPGQASRQLWATFQWSSLTGCIRMCPSHPDQITPDHFYGMCALDEGVWPGEAPRGVPIWNLRCRVGDLGAGDMFESDRLETQLQFNKDEYGTMRIFGKMAIFSDTAQKFSGVKVSHSSTELEESVNNVTSFWEKLSSWEGVEEEEEEFRHEICKGCKGKIDDSDDPDPDDPDSDDFDSESDLEWDTWMELYEAVKAREMEEEKVPWPSLMTGAWKLRLVEEGYDASVHGSDTVPPFMHIHEIRTEDGSRRQYWAEFRLSQKLNGILRFCHGEAMFKSFHEFRSRGETDDLNKAFERACVLEKGVKPGPPPDGVNRWAVKWRGPLDLPPDWDMREDNWTEESPDEFETEIRLKKGKGGLLTLQGCLWYNARNVYFEGIRTGVLPSPKQGIATIEQLWEQRAFKELPPIIIYKWVSPLPADPIEQPPRWAWDVLGLWTVDTPELFAEALDIEGDVAVRMAMRMDNSKSNPRMVGRQLWAEFYVCAPDMSRVLGSGRIRFCPLLEDDKPCSNVEAFEKACKLKKGVWPGTTHCARGKSFQRWGCRWRGLGLDGDPVALTDHCETVVKFKVLEDGSCCIEGQLAVSFRLKPFKATMIVGNPALNLEGFPWGSNAVTSWEELKF